MNNIKIKIEESIFNTQCLKCKNCFNLYLNIHKECQDFDCTKGHNPEEEKNSIGKCIDFKHWEEK